MVTSNLGWRKVAVSIFLVILGSYLTTLTSSRIAYAATLPVQNACKDGQEKDATLCYPKCKKGFNGAGSVCWQSCPTGFKDTGDTCTKTYPKDSTDRGPGTDPTVCFGNLENANGLCYVKCLDGDTPTPAGDRCFLHCQPGQSDIGASCVSSITRFSYPQVGIPAFCDSSFETLGGLCYPPCKNGYDNNGSACTITGGTCPSDHPEDLGSSCRGCRFGHVNLCDTIPKSYNRIASTTLPNQCASGFQLDQGRCHTPCFDGYTQFNGACWGSCPDGWTANGGSCELTTPKLTYSRGASLPPFYCSTGLEKVNNLCYSTCPTGYSGVGSACQKNCRPGETDSGLTCQQPPVAKKSYERGAGEEPPCITGRKYDTDSTNKLTAYFQPNKFTLIFASDPQFLSWRNGKDPSCNTDDCIKAKSLTANANQISAMNNIMSATWQNGAETITGFWPNVATITIGGGKKILKPLGVVMNGNLTNQWLSSETKLYRQYYETGFEQNPQHPVLNLPIFPGLGNHDYANNLKNCQDTSADANQCAKQAVKYMKKMVYCDGVNNFINTLVQRFNDGSLAYSYDIGNYHFVQLNNYPSYTADSIFVKSALPWLKQDLAIATQNGYKVVLNFHDFGDHFQNDIKLRDNRDAVIGDNTAFLKFKDAIKDAQVVAVFTGHVHGDNGQFIKVSKNTYIPNFIYGTQIPVFRSGASEYNTFLLVEFSDDHMNVSVINSLDGKPRFVIDPTQLNPSTYSFP